MKLMNWFKSFLGRFDRPLSNSTQRLSVWSGILTGVVSLVISVVAVNLSINQAKDHTQLDTLTTMTIELQKHSILASKQLKKLDETIHELETQNELLIKELNLMSKRYNYDSLQVGRESLKDYLKLKYAFLDANQMVEAVVEEVGNDYSRFRKTSVDSLTKAIAFLESQQDNNILLDNEPTRMKWVHYQVDISNFIDIDLRYNSTIDEHGNFKITNGEEFRKGVESLNSKNKEYYFLFGNFISSMKRTVGSLQMQSIK